MNIIVFLSISLALQLVGFATPGWFVNIYTVGRVELGLWFAKVCVDSDCSTYGVTKFDDLSISELSDGMFEYQVETTLALVLLVTALVLCVRMRCGSFTQTGNVKNCMRYTIVFTMISGLLAITAAGKFGNKVLTFLDKEHGSCQAPYSLILTGLGGLMTGFMSMVIFFNEKPWESESEYPPLNEMSALSAVVVCRSAQQPGYDAQPSVTYTSQLQHGNDNQPLVTHAGKPQYGNGNQPSVTYAGQLQPGYDNQPSVTNAGQSKPGYDNQHSVAHAGQSQLGYDNQPSVTDPTPPF